MGALHDIPKGQDWPQGASPGTGEPGSIPALLWHSCGTTGEACKEKIQALPCKPSLWDDPAAAASLAATLSIGSWENTSNK